MNRTSLDRVVHRCEVLVVGGGIVGSATAYELAKVGADVVLVEQNALNSQASGRNAGGLHAQIPYDLFVRLGDTWAQSYLDATSLLNDSIDIWLALPDELGCDLEVKMNGGLKIASDLRQMSELERKVDFERSVGIPSEIPAV